MNDTQAIFTDASGVTYKVQFQGRHLYQLTQTAIAQDLFTSVYGISANWSEIVLKDFSRLTSRTH